MGTVAPEQHPRLASEKPCPEKRVLEDWRVWNPSNVWNV